VRRTRRGRARSWRSSLPIGPGVAEFEVLRGAILQSWLRCIVLAWVVLCLIDTLIVIVKIRKILVILSLHGKEMHTLERSHCSLLTFT